MVLHPGGRDASRRPDRVRRTGRPPDAKPCRTQGRAPHLYVADVDARGARLSRNVGKPDQATGLVGGEAKPIHALMTWRDTGSVTSEAHVAQSGRKSVSQDSDRRIARSVGR